jgi:hypothetical protein
MGDPSGECFVRSTHKGTIFHWIQGIWYAVLSMMEHIQEGNYLLE